MEQNTTTRLTRALGFGALSGLGALIPLDRLSPRSRRATIWGGGLLAGAAAGAAMLVTARAPENQGVAAPDTDAPESHAVLELAQNEGQLAPAAAHPAAPALGVGLVAGGTAVATAAALWFTFVSDRAVVGVLRKAGVKRPRAWFALVGGVLGGVLEYADQREPRTDAASGGPRES